MTQREFFDRLARGLQQITPVEREKQIGFYREMLADMMEDGLDEATAVARLGSPEEIARTILQEQPLPYLVSSRVKPRGGWTAMGVTLVVLGSPLWLPLLLAVAALALSVVLIIWSVILVGFAVVLALVVGGLGLLVAAVFAIATSGPLALMIVGWALGCCGLGILAFYGVLAMTRGLATGMAVLIRRIKSLFIRKEA